MNSYKITVTTNTWQEFVYDMVGPNKNTVLSDFINSTDIHNVTLIKIEEI